MRNVDYWRNHARNMAPEIARLVALLADGSTAEMQHQIETTSIDWKQQMVADGLSPEDVDLVLSELVAAIEKRLAPLISSTHDERHS